MKTKLTSLWPLGLAIVAVAVSAFASSVGAQDAPKDPKEVMKKLRKLQAGLKMRLHATNARAAREDAADSDVAGFAFSGDSDIQEAIVPDVQTCLESKDRFVGRYSIGIVRSDDSRPSGTFGGTGGTDSRAVSYKLDEYVDSFMLERANAPDDGPGVRLVVDLGDNAVEYRWNKRWPEEAKKTGPIDDFIAETSFNKPHSFSDAPEVADNICNLLSVFEQLLQTDSSESSQFYIDRTLDRLINRGESLRKEFHDTMIARWPEGDDAPTLRRRAETKLAELDDRLKSATALADKSSGKEVPNPKEMKESLDALRSKVEELKSFESTYSEHLATEESHRRHFREWQRKLSDRRIEWLPYAATLNDRLEQAREAVTAYRDAVREAVDSNKLNNRKQVSEQRLTDLRQYAVETEGRFNIIVYFLPIGIVILLLSVGSIQFISRSRQTSRKRNNLELMVDQRRQSLETNRNQLDNLSVRIDEKGGADTPLDHRLDVGERDVPIDNVREAVDLRFSLIALEDDLLRQARQIASESGFLDESTLTDAEERLTLGSTRITPGSEWDDARLDSELHRSLEIHHDRLPDAISTCANLAASALEQSDSPDDSPDSKDDSPSDQSFDDPGDDAVVQW